MKRQFHAEDDVAAEYGLSPVSFAIYELIRQRAAGPGPGVNIGNDGDTHLPSFEDGARDVALTVEEVVDRHRDLVDWQANTDV